MRIETLLKGKVSEAEAKNLGLRDTEVYARLRYFWSYFVVLLFLPRLWLVLQIEYRET